MSVGLRERRSNRKITYPSLSVLPTYSVTVIWAQTVQFFTRCGGSERENGDTVRTKPLAVATVPTLQVPMLQPVAMSSPIIQALTATHCYKHHWTLSRLYNDVT